MAKKTLSSKKSKSSKKVIKTNSKAIGSIGNLAKLMAGIDICMMSTVTATGAIVSRPMSNNGDVKYDGTSYFFTWAEAGVVSELRASKSVNLAFEAVGKTYVSVAGKARLVTKKEDMTNHWNPDLEKWFPDGLETEGITMIEVKAKRIKYWSGETESEIRI